MSTAVRVRSFVLRIGLPWTLGLASVASVGVAAAATRADQVLRNAAIYTAEPEKPWVDAVAIKDGRIFAVGTEAQVTRHIGKQTIVTDLGGRMLMPGLVDSHAHPLAGGRQLSLADLGGKAVTFDGFRGFVDSALASGKAMHGNIAVIAGLPSSLWSQDLSGVFNAPPYADRAILFAGADGHTAWGNRALLAHLGITAATLAELPPQARADYHVDASGTPTGFAVEAGAARLYRAIPAPDLPTARGWLRAAIEYFHQYGVTAVLEANAGHSPEDGRAVLEVYRDAVGEGELGLRVSALLEARSAADLTEIYRVREQYSSLENLQIIGVKLYADGIVDYPAQTAAVLEPYLQTGRTGELKIPPEEMARIVADADGHDLLVHIHAIGDRAVAVALDAIQASRAARKSSRIPHTLAHLHLIAARDVQRFHALDAIASFQLLWATFDQSEHDMIKPYLSGKTWDQQYVARSVYEAGGVVAGGSDWPVSSGSPWQAIAQAMTREGPYGVLGSSQRMLLGAMLQAYTLNAAKALRRETEIGSIQVGKRADLILLERDPRELTAAQIQTLQPLWTMMDGRIVWRRQQ